MEKLAYTQCIPVPYYFKVLKYSLVVISYLNILMMFLYCLTSFELPNQLFVVFNSFQVLAAIWSKKPQMRYLVDSRLFNTFKFQFIRMIFLDNKVSQQNDMLRNQKIESSVLSLSYTYIIFQFLLWFCLITHLLTLKCK